MKTSNAIWWIVGVVILIGLLGWGVVRVLNNHPVPSETTNTATTTESTFSTATGSAEKSAKVVTKTETTSSLTRTYANSTYGFSITYPSELNTQPFTVFHMLNNNDWRVGATASKRGTPVISVPIIRIDNENAYKRSYPLFYGAEVRVGVSTDTAQCYATDDGYTNQTVTTVTINNVTWKKFIFGDAAMMKYINGASYRTIHNNKCYVIEQIQLGSTYTDPTLTTAYTGTQLKAYYAKTTPIIMSFKFLK